MSFRFGHAVLAANLAVSGLAYAESKGNQDEQAIKALLDQSVVDWNEQDMHGFAQAWSESGDLIDPFGAHAKGRKAIEVHMAKLFAEQFAGTTAHVKVGEIRFLKPDVAVADWDWKVEAAPAETEPSERTFHVVAVLKKQQGGAWLEEAVRAYLYANDEEGKAK